ncbi:magnesium-translocating P-type ATPase [Polynucleobacter sp. AP-Capit-er-40B-B4]|uniref:magnesium-translocating P-type ATPase n=1 Tax=Polynucleobacter sp. AP-Capit-er-40B-B4 TaxID=2576927 RepID=UPI001C0B6EEF|nr:magnesium-translocating P-type ATPase [Polynucleobacter sp. AP-Capit-er-40B-B4]MBU3581655.1 magnesium-translocating P-type ATPase [Polynucleobacter sp. AP-Capit-er-40B-B4]
MNNDSTKLEEIKKLASTDLGLLFHDFQSSSTGLSAKQWRANFQIYGPNTFNLEPEINPLLRFLKLFTSPLSLLLIGLSLVSYLTGEDRGAVMIALMVFLSATLTFTQEYKSNKAAKKLKSLVNTRVEVFRSGIECTVDLSEIVPGDIVRLSVGDLIPADVRIISSKDLFINQASITGESMPTEKSHVLLSKEPASSFDWVNLAFMGSHVVSGIGSALVLKTGDASFFGQVAIQTTEQIKTSSFDQGISRFTWLMLRLMAAMVPAVFLINGLIKGDWLEAALFAIAVGVGLAPEMLPMLVTINLAKGAIALSKKRVIVKRLTAVQSLGAMNILCTDKTGTLTQDEIILEKHIDVLGNNDAGVLEYAYLNSHYQAGMRNLLDEAVLKHQSVHEKLHSSDAYQKIDEIPFDFQRRRMSVVLRKNDREDILICKGAVEEMVAQCSWAQAGKELITLNADNQAQMMQVVADLNNDGFRVIAVAIKKETTSHQTYSVADESGLILMGFIAFLDPPKESAKPAIASLQACGIEVKILTGDNELITRKVCHEVGLSIDQVLLGSEIESLSDDELTNKLKQTKIFAKMTPAQKARVIRLLQNQGHVVGYLGDGINDGPGLKSADVSISVDSAVDIAKESADIILLEKSLLVLYDGVIEGRRVFGNIMKYLKMSASSNFGNMFSMLGASALLPFLPMAPIQILLNNLLYDFSQTAVPTDSVDPEYLQGPRGWDVKGLARFIFCIGPISSIFDYLTFGFLWFYLKENTLELSPIFQTGWFVESLLSQTLIVYVIRTGKMPFKDSIPSIPLMVTTLIICAVGVVLPFTAVGEGFQMAPLSRDYWYGLAFLLPSYLLLTQLVKTWFIKKWGVI